MTRNEMRRYGNVVKQTVGKFKSNLGRKKQLLLRVIKTP